MSSCQQLPVTYEVRFLNGATKAPKHRDIISSIEDRRLRELLFVAANDATDSLDNLWVCLLVNMDAVGISLPEENCKEELPDANVLVN